MALQDKGLLRTYLENETNFVGDDARPVAMILPTDGVSGNGKVILNWDEAAAQITRDSNGWGFILGAGATVTYAFRSTAPGLMPNGTSGFSQFSTEQIVAAEEALQLWSDAANITFLRIGSGTSGAGAYSNSATILFANYSAGAVGASAFAFFPGSTASSSVAGDIWVNSTLPDNQNFTLGSFGPHTLAHEIGHAVGLSHPSDYDASDAVDPTYELSAAYWQDSRAFSIMSYFGSPNVGGNLPAFSPGPQFHDIAAVQRLYGANMTTRTGDTVYGFNANTGDAHTTISSPAQGAVFSIWDAGGNDTLDLSGYSENADIDLRAGSHSSAGPANPGTGPAVFNISIALGAVIENAIGGVGNDTLTGNAAANMLDGAAGADQLLGGDGDDVFIGSVGDDIFDGGAGIDIVDYLSSAVAVQVALSVVGSQNTNIGDQTFIGIENLRGSAFSDFLSGDDSANALFGADGDDTLQGQAGNDVMDGADGVDLLLGEAGDDVLSGGAGDDILIGDDGADTLHGGDGNDSLQAGAGDTAHGGPGDDQYSFSGAAVAVEAANEGHDVLAVELNAFTLPANFEVLIFTGAGDFVGVGNDAANQIDGGGGVDTLSGLGGDDAIDGGAGADSIFGGDGADDIQGGQGGDLLDGGAGDDVIDESQGGDFADDLRGGVGNDTLIGGLGADTIAGAAGNDALIGGPGADSLDGGEGNDRLVAAAPGGVPILPDPGGDILAGGVGDDVYEINLDGVVSVVENFGEGVDAVETDLLAFSLANMPNVENLTFTKIIRTAGPVPGATGRGNALNNVIVATIAADTLFGEGGDDFLSADDGIDTLFGGDGADNLDGGLGGDAMFGGAGDDAYVVDNAGDVSFEGSALEGTDTVFSSVARTLGANLENLTLTGALAVIGNGNALANIIIGNNAANTLFGNGGNDALNGAGGNDILHGNAGNDNLDGGIGADTMYGEAGDDTYVVDSGGDITFEASALDGTDSVFSSVTRALGPNLENLTLTGAAAINGGGNGLANILIGNNAVNALFGNGGNDTLDGGQGGDKMYGVAGDDTYVVDNAGDVTFEGSALDGTDLVLASVTRSLGANLENLTLTGAAAINGIGNALGNIINGNAGANQLFGNLGDDVLAGGAGNDLLAGGAGNDAFVFAPGSGSDTVTTFLAGGTDDTLDFSAYSGTGITWTITQVGANTVFDFTNGDQITLTNVIAANLVQTDPFGFG